MAHLCFVGAVAFPRLQPDQQQQLSLCCSTRPSRLARELRATSFVRPLSPAAGPSKSSPPPADGSIARCATEPRIDFSVATIAPTVSRRKALLAAAAAATWAASAAAAVADGSSQPLSAAIESVLVLRSILESLQESIDDGKLKDVSLILKTTFLNGDKLKNTLFEAAGFLEGSRKGKARALAVDTVEYVAQIDSNDYFRSYDFNKPTSQEIRRDIEFSTKARQAAITSLDQFLQMMPREELDTARSHFQ